MVGTIITILSVGVLAFAAVASGDSGKKSAAFLQESSVGKSAISNTVNSFRKNPIKYLTTDPTGRVIGGVTLAAIPAFLLLRRAYRRWKNKA